MPLIGTAIGKRAIKVKARNDAIEAAAMRLAKTRTWPSPAAVSKLAGISESVVKREIGLLTRARRYWVSSVNQKHPQWQEAVEPSGTCAEPQANAGQIGEFNNCDNEQAKTTIARQRHIIRNLRERVAKLEESARRMSLGVRPAEISLILKPGSTERGTSKSHEGIGVDAKKNPSVNGRAGTPDHGV